MTDRPALVRRTEVESLRYALARLVRATGGRKARADAPLDTLLLLAASAAIRCEREEFPQWREESGDDYYRRVVRACGTCECDGEPGSCGGQGCPVCALFESKWPCPAEPAGSAYPRVFQVGDPDPGGDFAVEDEHGDVWTPSDERDGNGDRL